MTDVVTFDESWARRSFNGPKWLSERRSDAALAFAIALLAFVASVVLSFLYGPDFFWRANYGFGPEWDCQGQAPGTLGNLSCIKKPIPQKP